MPRSVPRSARVAVVSARPGVEGAPDARNISIGTPGLEPIPRTTDVRLALTPLPPSDLPAMRPL